MTYRMKLTAELLEQFAKVLEKYDLAEMRYEEEDCELHVVRKIESSVSFQAPMMQAMSQTVSQPSAISQTTETQVPSIAPAAKVVDASLEEVKAPIVGTAYLSPEPGAPAFIKVGDHIKKDQPIMIIEAMKVMNQLKSPISGTIKNIFVTNAKPVEFGDVLIIIQKD